MLKKFLKQNTLFYFIFSSNDILVLKNFIDILLQIFNKFKIYILKHNFIPLKKNKISLLRSPVINKKAMSQFKKENYKEILKINFFNNFVFLKLFKKKIIKKTFPGIRFRIIKQIKLL